MINAFSHVFNGAIWRMDIHERARLMAFEWRNEEGVPHFSVLHYPNGQLLCDGVQYGDRWWTLAGITAKHLLLHQYARPEQAMTNGLVAIAISSGSDVWERFDIQFQEIVHDGIAVKSSLVSSSTILLLDEHTGSIKKHSISLADLPPQKRKLQTAFPTLDPPPIQLTDLPVVGPYFFASDSTHSFWSYHQQINGHYQLWLAVIAPNNQIIFQNCIVDGLTHLLPETFFLIGQQLFFIRNNKREIVSYFV